MSTIAIIPARGGSKRIPRKNIRPFLGKPMIAYPIELLRRSRLFDRIIVSTDDTEIAAQAIAFGAEVPFSRPAELSDDHAGTGPVVQHAIRWLADQGEMPAYVCCVYATTPLLSERFLVEGLHALQDQPEKAFAFSVASFAFPPQRGLLRTPQDGVTPLFPEHTTTRSQDLDPVYHDAGQFYWGRGEAWLSDKQMFSDDAIPVVLPRHRVQDIDDEEDWVRAELMWRILNEAGNEHL